jgi:hypothetical protein
VSVLAGGGAEGVQFRSLVSAILLVGLLVNEVIFQGTGR